MEHVENLTYYGLIVLLIIAIALNLLRWWTEDKDRRDEQPDEHEDTGACRN
jgi:hypothetical protein